MITLTEKAAKHIGQLQKEPEANGNPLRLYVEEGGCSGMKYGLSFDEKKEGDILLEDQGIQIIIDNDSLSYIKGSEVDFDGGLNGRGFFFRNPNAHKTCGCGRSFN